MYSGYKSYGGSSIDSKAKRFFTVADTPYYDSFNYSINVIEYGNLEEYLTLPFRNYSIGGIVYDSYLQKLFGFVQTPADIREGVKYKTFLAELILNSGWYISFCKESTPTQFCLPHKAQFWKGSCAPDKGATVNPRITSFLL